MKYLRQKHLLIIAGLPALAIMYFFVDYAHYSAEGYGTFWTFVTVGFFYIVGFILAMGMAILIYFLFSLFFGFKYKRLKKAFDSKLYNFFEFLRDEKGVEIIETYNNKEGYDQLFYLVQDVEKDDGNNSSIRRELLKIIAKEASRLGILSYRIDILDSFLFDKRIMLYFSTTKIVDSDILYRNIPYMVDMLDDNMNPANLLSIEKKEGYELVTYQKITGIDNIKEWRAKTSVLKDILHKSIIITPNKKENSVQLRIVRDISEIDTKKINLIEKLKPGYLYMGEGVYGPHYERIDKMIHGVIGAATGSGKSVFVKGSILTSLIYNAGLPENGDLIESIDIIDPKRGADFSMFFDVDPETGAVKSKYPGINIIVSGSEILDKLLNLYLEMLARLLYNALHGQEKLTTHKKIIYTDEFSQAQAPASLDSRQKNAISELYKLLHQQARSANMIFISAMQKPSGGELDHGTKLNMLLRIVGFMDAKETIASIINDEVLDTFGADPTQFDPGEFIIQNGATKNNTHLKTALFENKDFENFISKNGVKFCKPLDLTAYKIKVIKHELKNPNTNEIFKNFFEEFLRKHQENNPVEETEEQVQSFTELEKKLHDILITTRDKLYEETKSMNDKKAASSIKVILRKVRKIQDFDFYNLDDVSSQIREAETIYKKSA